MPRLIVINNYSLARVREELHRGDKPAHHLYGIDRFGDMGFEVEIIPLDEMARPLLGGVPRLRAVLPPIGNLPQQARVLLGQQHHGDLIYAPCQTQTHLLSYLRATGLLRIPVVTLAHHPISPRWPWKVPFLSLQLRGTDAFPSLSRVVAAEIGRLSGRSDLSESVPWGPDLAYYPVPDGSPGTGAVAAGRTGRDFLTFGRAATAAAVPARILCLQSEGLGAQPGFGPNVTVTAVQNESDLNYRALVKALAAARVHAIPLAPGPSLAGLTSLTDALALGKPVIMTRHPLIDVDIEAEGIGRWVAPGDVAAWARALRWFEDHSDEAAEMGQRARRLAEQRYNSDLFARRMAAIFDRVLARTGA